MLQVAERLWQVYGQWFFVVMVGALAVIFLAVISRRLRRQNDSLDRITDRIQAYFDAITVEEEICGIPDRKEAARERRAREIQGNRDGDEMVLNSVIHEYFS